METWLRSTVDQFWHAAREVEAFPRALEKSILWGLPLAVFKIPRLWVRDMEAWLAARRIKFHLDTPNRELHACLIAHGGKGIVLVNGIDPLNEQRFSLAHECAHFIVDYLQPRNQAISIHGPRITDVLDGYRQATKEEFIDGVLSGMRLGVHSHLMERSAEGTVGLGTIAIREGRADRLALELLAPQNEVRKRLELEFPATFSGKVSAVTRLLSDEFGLPEGVAAQYGRALCSTWYGGPTVRDWLDL